jgi:hypothetical protein
LISNGRVYPLCYAGKIYFRGGKLHCHRNSVTPLDCFSSLFCVKSVCFIQNIREADCKILPVPYLHYDICIRSFLLFHSQGYLKDVNGNLSAEFHFNLSQTEI